MARGAIEVTAGRQERLKGKGVLNVIPRTVRMAVRQAVVSVTGIAGKIAAVGVVGSPTVVSTVKAIVAVVNRHVTVMTDHAAVHVASGLVTADHGAVTPQMNAIGEVTKGVVTEYGVTATEGTSVEGVRASVLTAGVRMTTGLRVAADTRASAQTLDLAIRRVISRAVVAGTVELTRVETVAVVILMATVAVIPALGEAVTRVIGPMAAARVTRGQNSTVTAAKVMEVKGLVARDFSGGMVVRAGTPSVSIVVVDATILEARVHVMIADGASPRAKETVGIATEALGHATRSVVHTLRETTGSIRPRDGMVRENVATAATRRPAGATGASAASTAGIPAVISDAATIPVKVGAQRHATGSKAAPASVALTIATDTRRVARVENSAAEVATVHKTAVQECAMATGLNVFPEADAVKMTGLHVPKGTAALKVEVLTPIATTSRSSVDLAAGTVKSMRMAVANRARLSRRCLRA